MKQKQKAVLMGPFVGEFYWECARFAPMLQYYKRRIYNKQDVKFIVFTREERFDLYGRGADILVPLRIPGDYEILSPNCFKLNGLKLFEYKQIAKDFKRKYSQKYDIVKHLLPDVSKGAYVNKNQFPRNQMVYVYKPRLENQTLVENYLPDDGKPLIVLAPRYRNGFKRNWKHWPKFYDIISSNKHLMNEYNFIICGKPGEYKPDSKHRFYDMNDIKLGQSSSLAGLLLVIMSKAYFTFGSQSAIPNISLLYGVYVLEFGCQKTLHTRTYNVRNTPITFIENKKYDIDPTQMATQLERLLIKKRRREKNG